MNRLLNDGWFFTKLPNGSTREDALRGEWQPVDLPHDWLIWQPENLYESADGWYRRLLDIQHNTREAGARHILSFDGVYMDCDVLINGAVVCTHRYGYTAFFVDITDYLTAGGNEIMVHIRHVSPNTRWYSGAGIFRDVAFLTLPSRHIVPDGVYVTTKRLGEGWLMRVEAELAGADDGSPLVCRLLDEKGQCAARATVQPGENAAACALSIQNPSMWSVDAPNCYTLEMTLGRHRVAQTVGFRQFVFSPDEGLFLNGKPVKLHGVCLHHDLGALGAAFNESAARRQLYWMKKMGVNAIRTSHNPPARRLMELCDRMGVLVINECFDMWEMPKTACDYARFFPENAAGDVARWVRRDRNHPSLLMWSIGNEIADTAFSERGMDITRMLRDEVRRHDPAGNGAVTHGNNFMFIENAQKCTELLKIAGYNYAERYYARHHAKYPDWVIYGSETSSVVSSRGVYHFPMDAMILSDEDKQCSALGNSCVPWGAQSLHRCLSEDLITPYSMGQFIWTGIDYIGEPTPYDTRSSYFGQMDTACFPKDGWFLHKAMWTDAPMAHIGIYWDWNAGQALDVPVMTNAASAELFLNGKSLGAKRTDRLNPDACLPVWRVPYEKGKLTAKAYDADGNVVAEDAQYSFGDSAEIRLSADKTALNADGRDIAFVEIGMADAAGYPVMNAADRVHIMVEGAGRLLGLDNGDPTDKEGYKTATRRLFNGKLLAMIGALDKPGDIRVTVSSPGKADAALSLQALPCHVEAGVSCAQRIADSPMPVERPVRKIEIVALDGAAFDASHAEKAFTAKAYPADADAQPIFWRVTNSRGAPSPCAEATETPGGVTVRALGDGTAYLRAVCGNGYGHARVMAHLPLTITGLGAPSVNPYAFVPASLYDFSDGRLSAAPEQGVSFFGEGVCMAGFDHVDFGADGADAISLPVSPLTGEVSAISLWRGDPRGGGELIARFVYDLKPDWGRYIPQTYRLPRRLTGRMTLCFTSENKLYIKGFTFLKQGR